MNAGQETLLNGYEKAYESMCNTYALSKDKGYGNGFTVFWIILEVLALFFVFSITYPEDHIVIIILLIAFPLACLAYHVKLFFQNKKWLQENYADLQQNYEVYKNEIIQVSKRITELNPDHIKEEMHKIYDRNGNNAHTAVMRKTIALVYEYAKYGDSTTRPVKCDKCYTAFEIPKSIIKDENIARYTTTESVQCPKCHVASSYINKPEYVDEQRRKVAEPVKCPRCGSLQFTVSKGFSVGKAVAGSIAFGDIGAVAGVGGGKIYCTCLKCGEKWKPIK